jgi:hypothetical protein
MFSLILQKAQFSRVKLRKVKLSRMKLEIGKGRGTKSEVQGMVESLPTYMILRIIRIRVFKQHKGYSRLMGIRFLQKLIKGQ